MFSGMLRLEIRHPDDGSKRLWNVGHYLPRLHGATSQKSSLYSSPWEPEISTRFILSSPSSKIKCYWIYLYFSLYWQTILYNFIKF
jgi:hypothetical protein